MVATPCDLALSSTALPVPESRLVIISTLAPLVIIWSAIVWNWVLSPWAFWMSYWTPAALNASSRSGLSAVSQRAEDLVSGRMTPTLGVLPPPPPPPPPPLSSSPPQAARMSVSAATAAIRPRNLLCMTRPFRRGSHLCRARRCPPPGANSIRAACAVVSLCLPDEVAGGRVPLADGRGRLGLEGGGPGQLPGGRLGAAGQGPGGLAGGPVGHVLARRGHDHGQAEHGRGDPPQRLRAGPAADQQHPLDRDPLGDQGVQAVGEAAQQPLDGRPGQARRGRVPQPEPVQGPAGGGPVGGALALQVRDQGESPGARRGVQGQLGEPVQAD